MKSNKKYHNYTHMTILPSKINGIAECFEVDNLKRVGSFENARISEIVLKKLKHIDLGCLSCCLITIGLSIEAVQIIHGKNY